MAWAVSPSHSSTHSDRRLPPASNTSARAPQECASAMPTPNINPPVNAPSGEKRGRTTSTCDSEISPSIASTCVPTSATASASAKACSAGAPWGACSSPQSDGSGRTRV